MKVSREVINRAVSKFAMEYLLPRACPKTQFALGFVFGVPGFEAVRPQMMDGIKAIGLADGDGMIDLDAVKPAVDSGLKAAGGYMAVDQVGVSLDKSDFDELFKRVEAEAGGGK